MSLPNDYLIDRRRLRRKVGYWRFVAIAALAGAALFAFARYGDGGPGPAAKLTPHIARLSIEGLITGDKDTIDLVKSIGDSHASAVLLTIDSPGGTTTGAEKLYDELRRLSAKKPVVAVVGTVAASGAYIAAIAADEIVARGNSLVGSVGVLFQFPNVSKLLETVGVKVTSLPTTIPTPHRPPSSPTLTPRSPSPVRSRSWASTLRSIRSLPLRAYSTLPSSGRSTTMSPARCKRFSSAIKTCKTSSRYSAWMSFPMRIKSSSPAPEKCSGSFPNLSLSPRASRAKKGDLSNSPTPSAALK